MPILREEQTTDCTHSSCAGLRGTLPYKHLTCPETGHLCRRVKAVAKLAQGGDGLDNTLARFTTTEDQEGRQHLLPRIYTSADTSPMLSEPFTPLDAIDTARRLLTALPQVVWGNTKTTLGSISCQLLNIAWVLNGCSINAQGSKLPPPSVTAPAPPNLATLR
jgi:hypothetical protein